MKKIIYTFLIVLLFAASIQAQRILINENFETTGFTPPDSLPPGWVKFNMDPYGGIGANWAVRDTGTHYIGVNPLLVSQAYLSKRALTIPWSAGGTSGIANDWVITDSVRTKIGDSLIFMMLLGSPAGFQNYIDSMQVWIMVFPDPALTFQKIATIVSDTGANVWKEYKFPLSAYAVQPVYIAFRYYMDVSVDGFWCNIDNVFVGNRASIGIEPIGSNIPTKFDLKQNYPNPFNPTTRIKFDLAKNTNVKLEIYNLLGQKIREFNEGYVKAGYYEFTFDASNLASGTYIYKLITDYYTETKKMVVVK